MIDHDLAMLLESLGSSDQNTLRHVSGHLPREAKSSFYSHLLGLETEQRVIALRYYAKGSPAERRFYRETIISGMIIDQLTGFYNAQQFGRDLELTVREVDRREKRFRETTEATNHARLEGIVQRGKERRAEIHDSATEREYKSALLSGRKKLTERRNLTPPAIDASLLCLDIDHFKRVNDTYGHPKGDHVLGEVAYWIKHSLREIDTRVYRCGGEEMAVILTYTNEGQGMNVAERIRKTVENKLTHVFAGVPIVATHAEYKPPTGVTLSIGVANYRETCNKPEPDILRKQADKALYQAKALGRNCVVVYEPSLGPV